MQLNRADVLSAAMTLLESEGLDGLTMRRLAGTLKVQPGALYWHFTDKKALLDAMSDELVAGVGKVDPDQPWDGQMAELAHQLRAALLSHRDGARLLAGTFVVQPNTLRAGTACLHALKDAGLGEALAGMTACTLLYYVLGHTIEEQAHAELVEKGRWPPDSAQLADQPELSRQLGLMEAIDDDERFQYGLDLFLDGLRGRLA